MSMGIARGLAAAAACAMLSAAARAQGVPSAHWRSTVTVEGARPGQPLQEAEIWLEGGRMRIEERGKGSEKTNILEADGEVYVWKEGETAGLRMSAELSARSGRPSHGYVRRVEEIRSRGQKTGVETVDGHPCDVYAYESPQYGKGTYWLARDLRGFPVRAVVERRQVLPFKTSVEVARVTLDYRNTEIRIPGKVPAERLAVPAAIEFQDAAALMSGRPPRR
ncbi:MAG: hypothetical protein ACM3SU_03515 [Acidobacteriota bacterium]